MPPHPEVLQISEDGGDGDPEIPCVRKVDYDALRTFCQSQTARAETAERIALRQDAELDLMKARLADSERDVARYRWLRSPEAAVCEVCNRANAGDGFTFMEGDELDAAIDAAMKEQAE